MLEAFTDRASEGFDPVLQAYVYSLGIDYPRSVPSMERYWDVIMMRSGSSFDELLEEVTLVIGELILLQGAYRSMKESISHPYASTL